jgi:MFS family permease
MSARTAPEERPASGAWAALGLALIAQVAVSVSEQGVVTLTGFIHDDLGLSATEAGLLVAALPAGRGLASYTAGRAVDRVGERTILLGGAVATGLAGLLASVTPAGAIMLALLLVGAFSATPTPAGGKLILLAFPRRRRGLAMGIRQTGIPLGGLIAALVLPWVAAHAGWRAGLAVMGGLTIGLALLAVLPRQPAVDAADPVLERPASPRPQLLRDRQLVLLTLWAVLMVGGQYVLVAFLPIYLHDGAGASLAIATALVAAVQLGGIAGRIAWGLLSDRVFAGRRRPLILGISVSASASFLAIALLPLSTPLAVYAAATFLGGMAMLGWQGIFVVSVSEVAGPEHAGRATGFVLGWVSLGIVVGPPLYGALADLAGDLRVVWIACGVACALATVPAVLLREPGGDANPEVGSSPGSP